ncbi:MAG: DASS family sodium-coupled anion symporter [Flavobacteriaceae bacterium]|nr:DASS family sodium-coupled anion symporter [Flavobacteriaceae bacterium]
MKQLLALALGPILAVSILLLPEPLFNPIMDKIFAASLWMVIWWITEAVSISITALLPIVIFPLLGVGTIGQVTVHYANPIVFLFFGGFVIALALEKVALHKRMALHILKLTGPKANGVIFGFMLATALLSMWISNTASTVVMLPMALSVYKLVKKKTQKNKKKLRRFAVSLMLGIAAAANIGGMATLIGTPPNSVMLAFLNEQYQVDIGFFQWMTFGVPLSALLLAVAYWIIVRWAYPSGLGLLDSAHDIIEDELHALGPIKRKERTVLTLFLMTVLGWVVRGQINALWPELSLTDTHIAMLGALALFVVPVQKGAKPCVLQWEDTAKLPWGILILFGGGLALANALAQGGFIDAIQAFISQQDQWSPVLILIALVTLVLFLTELMSNVALVTVFLPVIAGIALGLDQPLMAMVIPVTLASSCAFMLPMATPPNAIVFASGHVSVSQMVRSGFWLNLMSLIVILLTNYFLLPLIF